ncbi:MAG: PspC domain-containing protein [Ignavibacteria bacterium]|nr:PspC domain-containing protein [Ignavibacteria bacterium]
MSNDYTQGTKRLFRSRQEKMIAGVCGGVAEYLNIDPSIVRLVWVLLTLLGGSGILLYVIAWFIIPNNPYHIISESAPTPPQQSNSSTVMGLVMIFLGSAFLFKNLLEFAWWTFWSFWGVSAIAVVMIILGVMLITKRT